MMEITQQAWAFELVNDQQKTRAFLTPEGYTARLLTNALFGSKTEARIAANRFNQKGIVRNVTITLHIKK